MELRVSGGIFTRRLRLSGSGVGSAAASNPVLCTRRRGAACPYAAEAPRAELPVVLSELDLRGCKLLSEDALGELNK